jgi:O-acetylserine/cysteine efflux transporter
VIGVVIAIASPSGWESSGGVAWILVSCLVGALGSVFVKRIEVGGRQLQAWSALASFTVLMPLALVTEDNFVAPILADPLAVIGCLISPG